MEAGIDSFETRIEKEPGPKNLIGEKTPVKAAQT